MKSGNSQLSPLPPDDFSSGPIVLLQLLLLLLLQPTSVAAAITATAVTATALLLLLLIFMLLQLLVLKSLSAVIQLLPSIFPHGSNYRYHWLKRLLPAPQSSVLPRRTCKSNKGSN